jgi:hypothetical protein
MMWASAWFSLSGEPVAEPGTASSAAAVPHDAYPKNSQGNSIRFSASDDTA